MNEQNKSAIFQYLADLRDSGRVNMFHAGQYLEHPFNLSPSDAREALFAWMDSLSNTKG